MKNSALLTLICFLLLATSCQKEEILSTTDHDITIRDDEAEYYDGSDDHEPPCWDGIPDNLRILFIGNSFTDNYTTDIPTMFYQLALESGESISNVSTSAILGHTLSQHINNGSTQTLIDQGDWDFVILQENSGFLANATGAGSIFENSVSTLTDIISVKSPAAKILLYQVVPPVAYSLNYHAINNDWDVLFDDVASNHSNVSVTDVAGAFKTAYSSPNSPGFDNGNDILRLSSAYQHHFMNTGGFISAVTFYSDIFTEKPCVPAEMTFWLGGTSQGLDDVNNRVYNLDEILQIGYIHGFNSSLPPATNNDCPQNVMWALGYGPC